MFLASGSHIHSCMLPSSFFFINFCCPLQVSRSFVFSFPSIFLSTCVFFHRLYFLHLCCFIIPAIRSTHFLPLLSLPTVSYYPADTMPHYPLYPCFNVSYPSQRSPFIPVCTHLLFRHTYIILLPLLSSLSTPILQDSSVTITTAFYNFLSQPVLYTCIIIYNFVFLVFPTFTNHPLLRSFFSLLHLSTVSSYLDTSSIYFTPFSSLIISSFLPLSPIPAPSLFLIHFTTLSSSSPRLFNLCPHSPQPSVNRPPFLHPSLLPWSCAAAGHEH